MIVRVESDRIEVEAPAKLNLFLEVREKRSDGYHEIETLAVEIGLSDLLSFQQSATGSVSLVCDDPSLSCAADNLVIKAAERLREEVGCTAGASIALKKRIPVQAGLGGGSSDAAATLVGLNRLWSLGLSDSDLASLGAELGSDVPFFFGGPAAICRGRGEIVTSVPFRTSFFVVLVSPGVGLSTADVYRSVRVPQQPHSVADCENAFRSGDLDRLAKSLFNRLQPVSESLVPDLKRVRDALLNLDPSCNGSMMSGSGSAYFGLCPDRDSALAVAQTLEPLGVGRIRVVPCGP